MASIFGHALVATTITYCSTSKKPSWFMTRTMIYCSLIPDLDVIAFKFGISYGDFWGHRGFTHSLIFALLVGVVGSLVLRKILKFNSRGLLITAFILFLATSSHLFLDALTNGGLGVAAFSPFDNNRYFLPWQVIEVSPIGGAFLSFRGAAVLINEIIWIGLPCIFLLFLRGMSLNLFSRFTTPDS